MDICTACKCPPRTIVCVCDGALDPTTLYYGRGERDARAPFVIDWRGVRGIQGGSDPLDRPRIARLPPGEARVGDMWRPRRGYV